MSFSHPAWLSVGFFACAVLVWLWRRYDARQHDELARFVSEHLRQELTQSVSLAKRRARRALMLTALGLLFVALAGPLLGFRWQVVSRHGNEIIFAVDTSRSMSTPDVKPDRLTRAKLAIDDFTTKLDGDAIGLVAFAGSAYLVCPITLDYGAFHESLVALDTNIIPTPGTNIASAIREAQAALRRRPGADRVLILVTDGEDLQGDALAAAQAAASQDGLKIYAIGVGTPNGDLIPLSAGQSSGFVKDDRGNFVKSKLDETSLKAIAAATGGLYAPLGAQGEGFETLYRLALAPMLKHDIASRQQKIYTQRYQWPLAASLAALLLSLMVGNRRRVRRGPSASALIVFLAPSLLLATPHARASVTSARDAYQKGDYAAAAREYEAAAQRDPNKPVLQFNRGTAAYRAGQFPQAAQAFQESITRAPASGPKALNDQEDAYYNLGNTLYRSGQKTEKSSPQDTIKIWTDAVKAYDTALQLRADDADSKYNRDLVKRKIDALKQNQQNNQNNQQNQQSPSQGQGQGQGQGKGQGKGQNDPKQQGQPNQQPPQPNGAPPNSDPQQQQQQPPPQQPPTPPGQPNRPPAQQPPGQPNPPPPQQPGQGSPKPAAGEPPPQGQSGADEDDVPRAPGQMSRDEARQLLDSVKGDEKRALGPPAAVNDAYAPPPDKPARDW